MRKLRMPFLAFVLGVLCVIAVGAQANDLPPLQCSDFHIYSDALKGNALGDMPSRPVRVCLPPSYHDSPDQAYPVLVVIPGFGMFRIEDSIEDILSVRRPGLGTVNPAYPAKFGDFIVDIDGRARHLMDTGQTPEFILVEVSPIAGNASNWGLCSEIGGDYIRYIPEVVDRVRQTHRTKPGRNNLGIIGFSTGAYVAFIQAVVSQGDDGQQLFGAVGLLSPAGSNYAAPGPVPGEPIRVTLWRTFPDRVPMTNVPVHKRTSPSQTEELWGLLPSTLSGGGGKFFSTAWWSTNQIGSFNLLSPLAPNWTLADSFLVDENNPTTSAFDVTAFNRVASLDMRTAFFAYGAAGNLGRTPLIFTRGSGLDQSGNPEIPLHPEVPDQPALQAYLNLFAVGPGDHFTNLAYPGGPSNFDTAVKFVFARLGTQDGNAYTYNPSLRNRYAACAAQFPHQGSW